MGTRHRGGNHYSCDQSFHEFTPLPVTALVLPGGFGIRGVCSRETLDSTHCPWNRDYGPQPDCTREYFYLMGARKHDDDVVNEKPTFVTWLSVMCLFSKPFSGNPLLTCTYWRTSMQRSGARMWACITEKYRAATFRCNFEPYFRKNGGAASFRFL